MGHRSNGLFFDLATSTALAVAFSKGCLSGAQLGYCRTKRRNLALHYIGLSSPPAAMLPCHLGPSFSTPAGPSSILIALSRSGRWRRAPCDGLVKSFGAPAKDSTYPSGHSSAGSTTTACPSRCIGVKCTRGIAAERVASQEVSQPSLANPCARSHVCYNYTILVLQEEP